MSVDVVPSPNVQNHAVIGQKGDVVVLVTVSVAGADRAAGEVVYVKPALGRVQFGVGDGVGVAVGVGAAVTPGVGVAVAPEVGVGVGAGVFVGLGVGVAVWAGVEVGPGVAVAGAGRVSIWLVA